MPDPGKKSDPSPTPKGPPAQRSEAAWAIDPFSLPGVEYDPASGRVIFPGAQSAPVEDPNPLAEATLPLRGTAEDSAPLMGEESPALDRYPHLNPYRHPDPPPQ